MATVHGDPSRAVPLGDCPFQLPTLKQQTPFNMADVTLDEVRSVVDKAWAESAPGPSGTTYKIYKNCPKLLKRLIKAFTYTLEEEPGTLALGSC